MDSKNKDQNIIINGKICKIKSIHSESRNSILDFAIRMKLPINHSCGGMGTCGTCRVFILDGVNNLPPPNSIEMEFIEERGFAKNERLACQTTLLPNIEIEIPPKTKAG